METKLLYLDDSYQKEFDATVLDVITLPEGVFVVLNQTLFYPRGGGQPTDTGMLLFHDITNNKNHDINHDEHDVHDEQYTKQYTVLEVIKRDGNILHKVDKEGLKINDVVHGTIDWDRRYMLMRMHTASHLLDAVLYRDGKILVTGNELGIEKTRIDFNMPDFSMDKVQEYIFEANRVIQKNLEVKTYYLSREEAFKIPGIVKLAGALPPSIPVLRITEIVGLDIQADGGTHVHSLSEIGKINILTIENKGKDRKRIYFTITN